MPDRKNLTEALRVLRAVPEDQLHMNVIAEKATCGTACCLMGWICLDPWFRNNTNVGSIYLNDDNLPPATRDTYNVVRDVLYLDDEDATDLFALHASQLDAHAISKREVEDNLLRVLSGEPALPYSALVAVLADEDDEDDEDDA